MKTRTILLCALCWPDAAPAQTSEEWLSVPRQAGLILAHREANERGMIEEYVQRGETAERWTRMLTVQRFAGVIARGGTVDEWQRNFAASGAAACPGLEIGRIARFGARRPQLQFRAVCPRNPATGQVEVMFVQAVTGDADLHVVQIAFRYPPGGPENEWVAWQFQSITYCRRPARDPACG